MRNFEQASVCVWSEVPVPESPLLHVVKGAVMWGQKSLKIEPISLFESVGV